MLVLRRAAPTPLLPGRDRIRVHLWDALYVALIATVVSLDQRLVLLSLCHPWSCAAPTLPQLCPPAACPTALLAPNYPPPAELGRAPSSSPPHSLALARGERLTAQSYTTCPPSGKPPPPDQSGGTCAQASVSRIAAKATIPRMAPATPAWQVIGTRAGETRSCRRRVRPR